MPSNIAVISARRRRRLVGAGGATILVSDTFNRADNAASLGSTDGGTLSPLAWSALGGTWGISTNRAYQPGAATYHVAAITTAVSDVTVQVTLAVVDAGGGLGIAARVTDENNLIYAEAGGGTTFSIFKRVAGAFTSLGSFSQAPANGDVIKLVCSGNSLSLYINGVLRVSATDAFNNTAVKHGLMTGTALARFDDFSVTG